MISRRKFVTDIAGAILTVTVVPSLVFGKTVLGKVGAADNPHSTLEVWASQLNSAFQIHGKDGRVAKLKLVKAYPVHQQERRLDQFILIFKGPLGEALPEDMYLIKNAAIGTHKMQLAWCEKAGAGHYYQSGICRLRHSI